MEVLNGTQRAGVRASRHPRCCGERGLDVVFFGNADAAADSTRVVVRRGDPGRGKDVAEALGAGASVLQPDTFRRVDVSVILGNDFRPKLPLHP